MATINNAVAVVTDDGVTVNGTNVNLTVNVQTDSGRNMQISVTVPISDTTGQLDNALFSAIQASLSALGDTMPNNASLMVLGGRT